ncbi:MAG: PilZ domain-containing protein [Deltaproteobacteria bacterium]|nr:PilZ domain-containing protein [Deltaproteobacteria bacterium]MBW2121748.1 PilZ domain-containing protein [Deltaproteobacteria bacterium]
MERGVGYQERRNSVRRRMVYPAIYTRLDERGRPYDEKPSRSIDVSMGGMRLQSPFPVDQGERLDIDVALADRLISCRGEVVYVVRDGCVDFELGISISEIAERDRLALGQVEKDPFDLSGSDQEGLIIRQGQIMCPNCGEAIGSVGTIKAMIAYCKEFLGQCSCGLKYDIRISSRGRANISFPARRIELIC